jgi:hypothetical protein
MRRTLKASVSLLVLVTILSCDSFKEDFIEPAKQVIFSTTEYYVLPGSSVVIDLQSVIKQSYTERQLKHFSDSIARDGNTTRYLGEVLSRS